MKNIKKALGITTFVLLSLIGNAQAKAKEDPLVTFQKQFEEMFALVNTDSSTVETGKKSGLLNATPEFKTELSTSYKANPKKKMPFATKEDYEYSVSNKTWTYNASFGKYTAAQETQQKEMEDKLLKLVKDCMAKTDWPLVANMAESNSTKYLLNYRNSKTKRSLSLRISKRSTENVISIQVR